MKGEEIFDFVERAKFLEDKRQGGQGFSEEESIEYNKIVSRKVLFSLEDIKEYHNYVRKLLRNVSEIKSDLLERFKESSSIGGYNIIKEIVEEVCDNNLYLKGFWGKSRN